MKAKGSPTASGSPWAMALAVIDPVFSLTNPNVSPATNEESPHHQSSSNLKTKGSKGFRTWVKPNKKDEMTLRE